VSKFLLNFLFYVLSDWWSCLWSLVALHQSNIKQRRYQPENREIHTRFRRFWVVIISPVHSDSVWSGFHSIEYIYQTNRVYWRDNDDPKPSKPCVDFSILWLVTSLFYVGLVQSDKRSKTRSSVTEHIEKKV
jgi:hypothetical protein